MASASLPALPVGDLEAVHAWTAAHLGDLAREGPDGIRPSPRFRGGQTAATEVMQGLDLRGYASRRNQILPESARGASAVSPYVRHGLITLRSLWDLAAAAPARDARKYRDELLWQEYARHLYARAGSALRRPLRTEPTTPDRGWRHGWPSEMACVRRCVEELERDGWLVNQTRMWLSSQWTVRAGHDWRAGEDAFFAHLLDGSRAANRLGWQWTTGAATGRPYSFTRWQVEKRAPGLCATCALNADCPIADWPTSQRGAESAGDPRASEDRARLRRDPDLGATAGPGDVQIHARPDVVWLTAESLGDADPALAAHPELPVLFVFDEPLLRRLNLSGKRLTFLAESLADLALRRDVQVRRGRVPDALTGASPAVTFAPVPGFRRLAPRVGVAELHPWPWLAPPHAGSVTSFSAWRKRVRVEPTPNTAAPTLFEPGA